MSTTYTTSTTFTRTHARHLAAKVATDLRQCSLLHGSPSPTSIPDYMDELVELLVGGFVSEYEFGFKSNGQRIVCWRYVVSSDGTIDSVTGDPGHLYAENIPSDAQYYNFLTYSAAWSALPAAERDKVQSGLPFVRSDGSLPADGNGYWMETRDYGAAGVRISRREYRPI